MNKYFYIVFFIIFIIGCTTIEETELPCDEIESRTCLENKPYYCIDGEIVEKPEICGCPKEKYFNGTECIFNNCSDNTLDGECSTNKKSYLCTNGEFIYNPKLCGCPEEMILEGETCKNVFCDDGTKNNDCSTNISYFCNEGVLEYKPEICGCPENMYLKNEDCDYYRCNDGTIYGECSKNEISYLCNEGVLEYKPEICGCPENTFLTTNEKIIYQYYCDNEYPYKCGDLCWKSIESKEIFCCISEKENWFCSKNEMCDYINKDCKEANVQNICREFENSPKLIKLDYFYGRKGEIDLVLYEGINEYLYLKNRESKSNANESFYENYNEKLQKKYISEIIEKIKEKTANKDEQAKIAISLVQRIPHVGVYLEGINYYDELKENKYAYEVLYSKQGDGSEKTELLAYILKEMGYGIVIYDFEKSNFKALGIRCNIYESYEKSGYCFVRADIPQIISSTHSMLLTGNYEKRTISWYNYYIPEENPKKYKISEGISLKLEEEARDVRRIEHLYEIGSYDEELKSSLFNEYEDLFLKYDLYDYYN